MPSALAAQGAPIAPASGPRDLELVGQLGGATRAVDVEGDHAYFSATL